ncbi:hypothetical protein [Saccharibacillus sacchari]|uniref:Uncharacterized protein n=1 Tax=Saccharibacillus sacchari TaxID=456493 RepID=A0ACC6PAT0_9BACL
MGDNSNLNGKTPDEPVRYTSYGEEQMEIVRSGAEAIENFLLNTDDAGRLSLLLCLDRYPDPWFGYDLPYTDQIFEVLQREVLQEALDALGNTYNAEYATVVQRFADHEDPAMRGMARQALELLVSAKK